jgi:hypothetical protein
MWQTTIAAVNRYLPDIVRNGELWYGHADMNTGQRTATIYGALDAFFRAYWSYPVISGEQLGSRNLHSRCGICMALSQNSLITAI